MKLESIITLAQKAGKPPRREKSQAELRADLEQCFRSFKTTLETRMKEYEQALRDGTFEDADAEADGAGEKRKNAMQQEIDTLFARAEKMKTILDSHEPVIFDPSSLSADYTYTNPQTKKVERRETITLDLEVKLQEFLSFYKKTHVDLPTDFEDTIRAIWTRNYDDIQQAIEQNGFDDLLIIPPTPNIGDLSEKMIMEDGYYDFIQTHTTVQTLGGIPLQSPNTDKPRIVLVHNTQNLKDRPELASTLSIKGKDVKLDQILTLEDYLIFQRKYFEETNTHLDEVGWTWLATKSGARLVDAYWNPGDHRLNVDAYDPAPQRDYLGARSSRCFF